MLKSIRKLLGAASTSGTVVDIDRATSEIDIPALEAVLAAAEKRRADSLLDDSGTDEILAFERAVDAARIELERGRVALAELGRRRAQAAEREERAALEAQRAEAQAAVDEAVMRIESEYPGHAAAIAELAKLARKADAKAGAWLDVILDDRAGDLPAVETVAQRLGWRDEFFLPPEFNDGPSLPPVGVFCGYGAATKWPTHTHTYALGARGVPGNLAQKQMDNGPRWPRPDEGK